MRVLHPSKSTSYILNPPMDHAADNGDNNNGLIPLYVDQTRHNKRRFLDFLKASPSKVWLRKLRRIDWPALFRRCKAWSMHPMNMALLVWLFFVAAGLVLLFLLMTGILDSAIPSHSTRKRWTETANQIVNALFTIMCLYQHPRLVHHLVILARWRPSDAAELRSIYARSSTPRPHERAHIALVVLLLHLTCIAQYVYCSLFWGWNYHNRPDWAENLAIGVGTGSPVVAWVYTMYGPLRPKNKQEASNDEESNRACEAELKLKVYNQRAAAAEPEWAGGLLDCGDDPPVACLSFFCTFCVFGWNMERLGFGNMHVHTVTFVLLCVAPLGVFYVTALNISDDIVKYAVAVVGIVLCVLGLLYGGFWRGQMRKKFRLPANSFCCGNPAVTDFVQWVFCWWCSLAQEVRTGNLYEIEEGSFDGEERDDGSQPVVVVLPREGVAVGVDEGSAAFEVMGKGIERGDQNMSPPLPLLNPARR